MIGKGGEFLEIKKKKKRTEGKNWGTFTRATKNIDSLTQTLRLKKKDKLYTYIFKIIIIFLYTILEVSVSGSLKARYEQL